MRGTAGWAIPTAIYVLALGALGVTSKLALRDLVWQDLIVWATLGYIAVTAVLLRKGQARFDRGPGGRWALLTAVLAVASLICLYIALGTGDASKVVPVSASYPAVTLVLSALVLRERISLARIGGMALVIVGVVLLTVT